MRLLKLLRIPDFPTEKAKDRPNAIAHVPGPVDGYRFLREVATQPRDIDLLRHSALPPALDSTDEQLRAVPARACGHEAGAGAPNEAQGLDARERRWPIQQLVPVKLVLQLLAGLVSGVVRAGALPCHVERHTQPHIQRNPVLEPLAAPVPGDALRKRPDTAKVVAGVLNTVRPQQPQRHVRHRRILGLRRLLLQLPDNAAQHHARKALGQRAGLRHHQHRARAAVVDLAARYLQHG
mmetsp:Transcript_10037/g.25893  ORF Transcript_10037/g.25893 Transcript_10037/m.25893 type:complete len:237 (-) Transcript_10037:1375-2085(-)